MRGSSFAIIVDFEQSRQCLFVEVKMRLESPAWERRSPDGTLTA